MRIFYMGKEVRDGKGRWTSFKSRARAVIKKACIYSAIVAVAVGASYKYFPRNTVSYVAPIAEAAEVCGASCQELAAQLVGQKIEKLKDELVEDIGKCESGGAKDPDGLIIFDTNNEASVGHLQFQRATVIHYMMKFFEKAIDRSDAIAISIDSKLSHNLAKTIIFEEDVWYDKDKFPHGSWANWYNCSMKVNAPVRVAAIKAIAK